MTCTEFQRRSITKRELLQLAGELNYPRCTHRGYTTTVLAGRRAWHDHGLTFPDARRDLFQQLTALQHREVAR